MNKQVQVRVQERQLVPRNQPRDRKFRQSADAVVPAVRADTSPARQQQGASQGGLFGDKIINQERLLCRVAKKTGNLEFEKF